MGSDWTTCTLGELGPIKTGKTPPSSLGEGFGGSVPFVTPGDMNGQKWITDTDRHLNESGLTSVNSSFMPARSVAVSCIGSDMGKAALLSKSSVTNQQINTIAVDESKFNAEFVYYDLSVRQQELKAAASGSATPILNKGHFSAFEISVPPKATQDKIAGILGRLDDKIDLNRHINKTLEAMAQAIFKSWFVDFDPVKAKIAAKQAGLDPLRAAMSAISGKLEAKLDTLPPEEYTQLAATAALFPDEMEDSELGAIPKEWSCGVLGDICSFTAGSAFKLEHQGSAVGDYPFIKVSDMNIAGNEVFIQLANNYVSKAQQLEMKAKLHPIGATVFAKIGVALVSNRRRFITTPTIIDNNLMSASPIDGKAGQYFLYSMLCTLDFNLLVSGTALPYINVSDLRKIPIARPSNNIGRAFEIKVFSIFSMMHTLAAQSSTLIKTRDALLPKLLSGEIDATGKLES